jgi:hypothetical protein
VTGQGLPGGDVAPVASPEALLAASPSDEESVPVPVGDWVGVEVVGVGVVGVGVEVALGGGSGAERL